MKSANKDNISINKENASKDNSIANEPSWKNYLRVIENYLISLSDIKNYKIEDLKKNRIICKSELKKQLKISMKKLGPVNFVCRNLINDINTLNEYENKLENTIHNICSIIDKLEFRVFECLKFMHHFAKKNEQNKNFEKKEFTEAFEEKLIKAYKVFSKFILNKNYFKFYFHLKVLQSKFADK